MVKRRKLWTIEFSFLAMICPKRDRKSVYVLLPTYEVFWKSWYCELSRNLFIQVLKIGKQKLTESVAGNSENRKAGKAVIAVVDDGSSRAVSSSACSKSLVYLLSFKS